MTRFVQNVEVAGRRTSFKLERPFWDAVRKVARELGWSVDQLFTHAVKENQAAGTTMSSAIRVFLIQFYLEKAKGTDTKRSPSK
jgi:predicted DNA-binding ribbon-helix-helix protein